MTLYESAALIGLAALIHAHFQLSVSMLTLMSGHALGSKTAHRRLLNLMSGFVLGALIMTACVLAMVAFSLQNLLPYGTPPMIWSMLCGIAIGVGVAVWVLYYRRARGTILWMPRPLAQHLSKRAEATKSSAEAFSLGVTSILGELLFSLAPLCIAATVLVQLDVPYQLAGLIGYTLIATLPQLIIVMLVGGGHSLGKIQRWRERNKHFLQFTSGSALIILGVYLYVEMVISRSIM